MKEGPLAHLSYSELGCELCCQKRKFNALTFDSNPLILWLATATPCCMIIFSTIEPSGSFGKTVVVEWF